MSRFKMINASVIARQAFRLRVDDSMEERRQAEATAPLLGKERKLLAVLRKAEKTYDEWLELAPIRSQQQKLIARFPHDCERLKNHLERVLACWSEMRAYQGPFELATRVKDFASEGDIHQFVRRVDETLQDMLAGAQAGATDESFTYRGRPRGKSSSGACLPALDEFTKVVRHFWVKEISDTFGYDDGTLDQQDGRREATSAAARLLVHAAKILDERFDLGNVRSAMEAVNRDDQLF